MVFNNGFTIIYGVGVTDSDGTARITLPISFTSNTYGAAALHVGSDFCDMYINISYKSINFLPIVTRNANTGRVGQGWYIYYVCIGY